MAYLITKSDGTTLTTVSDGQIDDLSTDLTLIGKNYSGFGESLNENFVKLLENFASTARPTRPVRGQIWFDVTELKLKVYNGTAFQPVSSATIAATQPISLTPGDLWFDDTNKQLYFYDGENTLLLGPSFGLAQGLSGIRVTTILDTLNQSKVITSLYNNGTLIGIFSSAETEFTPKIPIGGFSGTITAGFNAGTIPGIKFNVTATNAETLGKDSNNPNGIPASSYVRRDESTVVTGKLGISGGIEVGTGFTGRLLANNGELLLQNVALNKAIKISANRGNIQDDVITIDPSSQAVNIYNGFLASETTIGGNLTIKGDLTVEGNTVAVDVSTLRVENKQIELGTSADSSILTNEQADGGGIILRSSGSGGDKEIYWSLSNDAWTFNQHVNLERTKSIRIGGVELLKYNEGFNTYELTNSVTRATGISIFGVQSEWTVDNVFTNTNRISIINSAGDLELEPTAGNNVSLVGLPRITGLGEPLGSQDATNKSYVDTQLRARSLAFSFDISDGISNTDIATWLTQIAPVAEYGNGTIARLLCTYTNNLSTDIDSLLNAALNESDDTFNTPTGTASALTDVSFNTVTIPAPAVSISRLVKTYQIIAGAWTFVS
jgi:hypothetical protein